MAAYLLPCSCGKTVPVEVRQAGGRVTCSCGTQLEVPALRQLRQLPQQQAVGQPRSASSWGTRQGWVAVSLIVVAFLVALAFAPRGGAAVHPHGEPAATAGGWAPRPTFAAFDAQAASSQNLFSKLLKSNEPGSDSLSGLTTHLSKQAVFKLQIQLQRTLFEDRVRRKFYPKEEIESTQIIVKGVFKPPEMWSSSSTAGSSCLETRRQDV